MEELFEFERYQVHLIESLGSLHHFLADANGSDQQMLLRVRQWVVPLKHFSDGDWWIIDDTALPKQGRHSAGVARQ